MASGPYGGYELTKKCMKLSQATPKNDTKTSGHGDHKPKNFCMKSCSDASRN